MERLEKDRLNSKAQTLTYIECRLKVKVGVNNIADVLVSGELPNGRNYIPIVIGHSENNKVTENIFIDGGQWRIYSSYAQDVSVRFFKCIK